MAAGATSNHSSEELGLTLQTLTPNLARQYGYEGERGVLVTQVNPGSVAAQAGLEPGTLIEEVNRKRVQNIDEFRQAFKQSEKTGSVLFYARVGEYSRYVVLSIGN